MSQSHDIIEKVDGNSIAFSILSWAKARHALAQDLMVQGRTEIILG